MTHPSDIELAAWVDEPGTAGAGLASHVAACDACRATVAGIEAARAALALDPPLPSDADFAAQRERIAAAIGAGRPSGARVVRRLAWLTPLAAAAAIAAFVLVGRTGPDAPPTADAGPGSAGESASAPIPLFADAREAAELAASEIAPGSGAVVVPSEAIDEELLDAALAAAEPLAPPASVQASMTTESRFAALDEEDQSAVLSELASLDLDL